ncbi:ATP-binding protein [Pelotomaculum isophthalicicum JI]|uniref:ATP-binding protein n=1 Tax=Pelotomaculum isophthalicicum JI TaxID=947010 RepID=A0A9X4GZN1_9FIRM|nr:ASKHA domain-containing protein [Pelotomaculum isophthalicicum]MDF9408977.1 ATP-binding protein [Pelotomaculum isophthalicicum JI]
MQGLRFVPMTANCLSQLVKGVIVAGIKTLLARVALREEDIGRVYLAGAFGTYVRPRDLIRLGFSRRDGGFIVRSYVPACGRG